MVRQIVRIFSNKLLAELTTKKNLTTKYIDSSSPDHIAALYTLLCCSCCIVCLVV